MRDVELRRNEALARQISAVREKYGRYPAIVKEWDPNKVVTYLNAAGQMIKSSGGIIVKPCKSLPGKEDMGIPELPDEKNLTGAQKAFWAYNREDYRSRVRKLLPRSERLKTYSRDLRERVNSTRIAG